MRNIFTFMLMGLFYCVTALGQSLYGYRIVPSAQQGMVSFSPETPSVVTSINNYREFDSFRFDYTTIVAGEFVKGDYYYSSLYGSTAIYPGTLTRLNTDNWEVVASRQCTDPYSWPYDMAALDDMSYDYTTDILYGLLYSATEAYLVKIDTKTLDYTYDPNVNLIRKGLRNFAFDLDGTCYAIGYDNNLYTLNPNTGAVVLIGSTDVDVTNSYRRGMAFNH
ncbi:MAG: hypothetical protein LBG77_03135, partial [Dysgonamonadaceae bacterium]|nr:hypothetical protein [Dysgonamonadaceae bacterium]